MLHPIDQNFLLHASLIPDQSPNMQVVRLKSLAYIDSGLSCDTFNIIHIYRNTSALEKEIHVALEYFRTRNLDYCIWISSDIWSSSLKPLFQSLNLTQQNEEIGMTLDLSHWQPDNKQPNNAIEIIQDKNALQQYAKVIAANWNPPDQNVITYYQQTAPYYLNPNFSIQFLVYQLENEIVSSLEMFPTDQHLVGFYGFATLEAYRGKGIGSQLMQYALSLAQQLGYQRVVLQASEAGLGIYQKLGFQAVNRYFEFA